ncbi:unnamed protein product, partial [Urochloa decumbens]
MSRQPPLSSGEVITRILAGGRHRQLVVKDKRIVNRQHDENDEHGLGGHRHREEPDEADDRRRVLVDVPDGGQAERQHLHGQRHDGERDERVRPGAQPPVDGDGGHVPARRGEQRHVHGDERQEQRRRVRRVRAVARAVGRVRQLPRVRRDVRRRGEHHDVRREERQAGERHGDRGRRRRRRAGDGRAEQQERGGEHPWLGDAVRDERVGEAGQDVAARREQGASSTAEEREPERLGGGEEPREEGEQEAGAPERGAQVEDAAQAAAPRAGVEGDEHERSRHRERGDGRGGGGGHEVGGAGDGRPRDLPGHEGLLDRDAGLHCCQPQAA